MAEEVKEQVDPAGIPEFTGNLEQLDKDITGLKKDASAIRGTGSGVHSTFQGLSAFYDAPEAEQLFATTKPVREKADDFADDLEKVTAALSGYATEARPLVAKLKRLKAEATSFLGSIQGDDDWKEDGDKVKRNNDLVQEISATVAQFWEAERRAANKITALVGGTQWTVGDGSGGKNMYGLSVEDMKKAGETPWGSAVEQEYAWYRVDQHAKSFIWDGVIVDGIWGTLKGLGTLVNPWSDGFADAWKGLAQLATGIAMTSGLGALTYKLMPDGPVKDWMSDSWQTTKQVGKELVAWDMWSENPARAAGLVTFNVVTTIATGGAGAATKAGTAGKVLSAAGKAGKVIDPMTYLGKGIGTGLKSLPKITDITTGLKGLNSIEAVRLPDGNLALPNGKVLPADAPLRDAGLPPGKTALEITNNTPHIPKGTIKLPDGTYMTPKGDLLDSTGTLKQPADAAPTDITTRPTETPAAPQREPALVGANTPDNLPGTNDLPGPGGTAPDGPTASTKGPETLGPGAGPRDNPTGTPVREATGGPSGGTGNPNPPSNTAGSGPATGGPAPEPPTGGAGRGAEAAAGDVGKAPELSTSAEAPSGGAGKGAEPPTGAIDSEAAPGAASREVPDRLSASDDLPGQRNDDAGAPRDPDDHGLGGNENWGTHNGESVDYAEVPDRKAVSVYERIRANTDDVPSIADNTGIDSGILTRVKEHLFLNKHDVQVGPNQTRQGVYFTAYDEIADLWTKAERGTLKSIDEGSFRGLIAHEYVESRLMEAGLPYRSDHAAAWEPGSSELDPSLLGAHDVAPISFRGAPITAEGTLKRWPKMGLIPPSVKIADDLSNLDEVVNAAKKGLSL
ncbi:hypothetical protein [Streptomyces gobiensis]|uniref:hypothetical protein n=1 Tax=Streptomyces gobiensis TaxID=2875706 RepID=UPI001E5AD0D9|nr:hypothetical protein [Streptomyces gobiensis]UGY93033.1 hypothetical protein test1122_15800 [Streptomyces gobiensis]